MSQNDIKDFASYASRYFLPKLEENVSDCVRFYRAEVTKAASGGYITVKRPFDSTEQALPYVKAMESAAVGSQVIVFVFGSSGNANNSVIVNDGKFSK